MKKVIILAIFAAVFLIAAFNYPESKPDLRNLDKFDISKNVVTSGEEFIIHSDIGNEFDMNIYFLEDGATEPESFYYSTSETDYVPVIKALYQDGRVASDVKYSTALDVTPGKTYQVYIKACSNMADGKGSCVESKHKTIEFN